MLNTKSISQSYRLDSSQPFLRVIEEVLQAKEKAAITLRSSEYEFWVLVDRDGPFSAGGAGLSGKDALRFAARLSMGICEVTQSWPTEVPSYQLGLGDVIAELLGKEIKNSSWIPPMPGPSVRIAPKEVIRTELAKEKILLTNTATIATPVEPIRKQNVEKVNAPLRIWDLETNNVEEEKKVHKLAKKAILWTLHEDPTKAKDYSIEKVGEMLQSQTGKELNRGISKVKQFYKSKVSDTLQGLAKDWEKSGEVAKAYRRKTIQASIKR